MDLLDDVIQTLMEQRPLAAKHKDHALSGVFAGMRECHVQPDWLLMYRVNRQALILTVVRTGTHDDLDLE